MARKAKWRPESGSEDAIFGENPRARKSRGKKKPAITSKAALALFNAEKDKYSVAAGLKACSVLRRVIPLPSNGEKRKSLFKAKDVDGAREWIERRAIGKVVRAVQARR